MAMEHNTNQTSDKTITKALRLDFLVIVPP